MSSPDAALRLASSDTLRGDWLSVRQHIEALRLRHSAEWLLEDVYHLLRSGLAQLWLRDPVAAFFVTLQQAEPWTGRRVLTVWIGWNSAGTDVLRGDMDHIRMIAAAQGCEAVKFVSSREGWQRHAKNIGFRFDEATYQAPAMTQENKHG